MAQRFVGGMLMFLLCLWVAFWWGHRFGVTTADRTWVVLEGGDRHFLQTLLKSSKSDVESLRGGIEAYIAMSNDRTNSLHARYDSVSAFLAYPLMGTLEQWRLSRIRDDARN